MVVGLKVFWPRFHVLEAEAAGTTTLGNMWVHVLTTKVPKGTVAEGAETVDPKTSTEFAKGALVYLANPQVPCRKQ
jgi:hypothetical protein